MTDLEYADAKQAIRELDMNLSLADFLKQLYWVVFSHHDEESMYVCSMEKHCSFMGGAGA